MPIQSAIDRMNRIYAMLGEGNLAIEHYREATNDMWAVNESVQRLQVDGDMISNEALLAAGINRESLIRMSMLRQQVLRLKREVSKKFNALPTYRHGSTEAQMKGEIGEMVDHFLDVTLSEERYESFDEEEVEEEEQEEEDEEMAAPEEGEGQVEPEVVVVEPRVTRSRAAERAVQGAEEEVEAVEDGEVQSRAAPEDEEEVEVSSARRTRRRTAAEALEEVVDEEDISPARVPKRRRTTLPSDSSEPSPATQVRTRLAARREEENDRPIALRLRSGDTDNRHQL